MVLVRLSASLQIRSAREMSGIKRSAMPPRERAPVAAREPEEGPPHGRQPGAEGARNFVESKTGAQPTGYPRRGTVLEAGSGVEDLVAGELVACAGAQRAHHAEAIRAAPGT